jgi:hypothetical protein
MSHARFLLVSVLVGIGLTVSSVVDVLQHHVHDSRDGLYIDPSLTQDAALSTHRDWTFNAPLPGPVYAQPLYVSDGPQGRRALIVATEQNVVLAIDARDGSWIWAVSLGTPVPQAALPCGAIDPLGVTGTPALDASARVIYVNAMTTPDDGTTKQHLIYALSLEDGSTLDGWPVDVNTLSFGGAVFNSTVQNQRGALLLNGGYLYVPYGGHAGDCGQYHGWVVAVPVSDPGSATAWATDGLGGGIWAPGGLSSDAFSIFASTGNTVGADEWMGGEAVIRLHAGATFSHDAADYFAPSNWQSLDASDLDLGAVSPLVVDVPGATPSQLVVALGKNGVAYLLDRNYLGGIGTGDGTNGEGLFSLKVATGQPRIAPATYTTSWGTHVVFSGGGNGVGCPGSPGDLVALLINPDNPPSLSVAWCASNHGRGSPIVTTTDGSSNPIVWTVGAEGTNRLYAFDGETGDILFTGGGADEQMTTVRRFSTLIAADGRIFVAADDQLYAFTTQ